MAEKKSFVDVVGREHTVHEISRDEATGQEKVKGESDALNLGAERDEALAERDKMREERDDALVKLDKMRDERNHWRAVAVSRGDRAAGLMDDVKARFAAQRLSVADPRVLADPRADYSEMAKRQGPDAPSLKPSDDDPLRRPDRPPPAEGYWEESDVVDAREQREASPMPVPERPPMSAPVRGAGRAQSMER